jgi:hypothetical protein
MTPPFTKKQCEVPAATPFLVLDGIPLMLMAEDELIKAMRFDTTEKFRSWCRKLNIRCVPHRKGFFVPKHVRARLDAAQGIAQPVAPNAAANTVQVPISLTEQRRARRGQS